MNDPSPLENLRAALEVAEEYVGGRAFVLEATPWPPPDLEGQSKVATVRLRTNRWNARIEVYADVGDE